MPQKDLNPHSCCSLSPVRYVQRTIVQSWTGSIRDHRRSVTAQVDRLKAKARLMHFGGER